MKITRALFVAGLILLWTGPAGAQDCAIAPTAIIKFRMPEFSTPIVWKSMITGEGREQFFDGVVLDDHSVIAGGAYTLKKDKKETNQPLLVRVERRGEVVWDVRGTSETARSIERIMREGDHVIALESIGAMADAPGKIGVTRYDLAGKRLGGFVLSEGDGHLTPAAIVPAEEGYYIAARYQNLKKERQHFGVVYRTDKDGKRLWRRAYIPGLTTSVDTMIRLKNKDLLLAGSIKNDADKVSGWMVRLDQEGGIKWQTAYPRGRAARLTSIVESGDGSGYMAGGLSQPIGAERAAAWMMKVDTGGNRIWERYYKGADDYRVSDVGALGDGRAYVVIDAMPMSDASRADIMHTRLVTLSPRGELVDAESVIDADGLQISRAINVAGKPTLLGYMKTVREAPKEGAPPLTGMEAWLGELQSLPAYDDPCRPR